MSTDIRFLSGMGGCKEVSKTIALSDEYVAALGHPPTCHRFSKSQYAATRAALRRVARRGSALVGKNDDVDDLTLDGVKIVLMER